MKTSNFLAYFVTTPSAPTPSDLALLVASARRGFERHMGEDTEPTHVFLSENVLVPDGVHTVDGLTLTQDTSFRGARLGVGILEA